MKPYEPRPSRTRLRLRADAPRSRYPTSPPERPTATSMPEAAYTSPEAWCAAVAIRTMTADGKLGMQRMGVSRELTLQVGHAEASAASRSGRTTASAEELATACGAPTWDVRRVRAMLCQWGLLAVVVMYPPVLQLQLPRELVAVPALASVPS